MERERATDERRRVVWTERERLRAGAIAVVDGRRPRQRCVVVAELPGLVHRLALGQCEVSTEWLQHRRLVRHEVADVELVADARAGGEVRRRRPEEYEVSVERDRR